ncbi:MAG: DNA gyrase subunit A [Succinivibrionaceae bacterium]
MSDNSTPQQILSSNVENVKITEELKTAFINYAMSVIVDRALPNVCDGLKPVHRRTLYAMYKLKNFYGTGTKKSARIVGDVIGKYHPHGDTAVYETIVRMVQDFSLRYPLIHGQGNFGGIDGDGAAAMRYTEICMAKIASEMVADLEKETVDTVPNYDNTETIPVVMPNKFPNLLVNGSSGIAVGMATNIPPHNMTEVVNAVIATIDNPNITLDELMNYIPAPDFPTGGIIYGTAGVRQAYETGNGKVVIRAKTHIEGEEGGKQSIVIDEIPYGINKKDLVEKINQCIKEKTIDGMTSIEDYSGKDYDVRVVINLRQGEVPDIVLNKLYKQTRMQITFPINMLALVDNHPEVLSLKQIINAFIKHRREIVTRRTVFDLKKVRERAHRLEAFAVALNNIDEIIAIIKSSADKNTARDNLMKKGWSYGQLDSLIERATDGKELCRPDELPEQYGCHNGLYYLSLDQTNAILEMQLHRLTGLEYTKIVDEYKDLVVKIKEFLFILSSEPKLMSVIRDELTYILETYGDKRKSIIERDTSEITKKDLIVSESAVITLSNEGYIKYQPLAEYDAQKRGGRGRRVTKMKEDDSIDSMYVVNTHDTVMCFTSLGRVFSLNVYDLPLANSQSKGRPIVNLLRIQENEKVKVILPVNEFDKERYLFFATANGLVKKTNLYAFRRVASNGLKAINLDEGDELINVVLTSGNDTIALFSSDGYACCFNEYYPINNEVEAESEVDDNDTESDIDIETDDDSDNVEDVEISETLETSNNENSDVAKVKYTGVRPTGRTSRGIRGIRLRPGTTLVSMIVVDPSIESFILACENGFGKRTLVSEFPLRSRNCKGVIAIKTSARNGKLIGVVQANENDQIVLVNSAGILVRTYVKQIGTVGRTAQGVRLIKLDDNLKLVTLQRVAEEDISDQAEIVDAEVLNNSDVIDTNDNEQQNTSEE